MINKFKKYTISLLIFSLPFTKFNSYAMNQTNFQNIQKYLFNNVFQSQYSNSYQMQYANLYNMNNQGSPYLTYLLYSWPNSTFQNQYLTTMQQSNIKPSQTQRLNPNAKEYNLTWEKLSQKTKKQLKEDIEFFHKDFIKYIEAKEKNDYKALKDMAIDRPSKYTLIKIDCSNDGKLMKGIDGILRLTLQATANKSTLNVSECSTFNFFCERIKEQLNSWRRKADELNKSPNLNWRDLSNYKGGEGDFDASALCKTDESFGIPVHTQNENRDWQTNENGNMIAIRDRMFRDLRKSHKLDKIYESLGSIRLVVTIRHKNNKLYPRFLIFPDHYRKNAIELVTT